MLRKPMALLLALALICSLSAVLAAPSSPVIPTVTTAQIATLDDCAGDALAPLAAYYVGNARTYKFHVSNCRYVGQMNEGNKVYFDSRDEAINNGYVPCKICRP